MDRNNVIKLADFGIAKYTQSTIHTNTYAGTIVYMSPELSDCRSNDDQSYSFNTDIWFELDFYCRLYIYLLNMNELC